MLYSLLDTAPDDGLFSSETCRASKNSKTKNICKICASCWFFYTHCNT